MIIQGFIKWSEYDHSRPGIGAMDCLCSATSIGMTLSYLLGMLRYNFIF